MTSRAELFKKIGATEKKSSVEMAKEAFLSLPTGTGLHEELEDLYVQDSFERSDYLSESPHGHKWHTSFHSSAFPGSNPEACGRRALYRMMGFAPDGPTSTELMAAGEAGSDLERRIVDRWHRSGILLSAPPSAPYQTVLIDEDAWLTCALDAVLDRRPHFDHVFPVDVKSVRHAQIAKIARGEYPIAHEKYVRQLLVQTYFCRKYHDELVPKDGGKHLKMAEGGSLYYVSRDMPRTAIEVWIPYDEEEMKVGLETLSGWQFDFLHNILPQRDIDWRWTFGPCRDCPFKANTCRKDVFDNVTNLTESNGVAHAEDVYKEYKPLATRAEVLERWEVKENE